MNKKILSLALLSTLALTGCSDTENDTKKVSTSLEGVLIFQVYGTGGKDDCALSNSFVELYNTTDNTISLDGSSIQYSMGQNEWDMFKLSGTIDSKSSFLITFDECDTGVNSIMDGDLTFDYTIDNKIGKFCLLESTELLTVVNPFESEVENYIDMVCTTDSTNTVDAAEGIYVSGQSKQKSIRRVDLNDTNDNSLDFEIVDYSTLSTNSIINYIPKNQSYGQHNPIVENVLEQSDNALLIYQVYGTGGKTDSAINRTYIELYNNSNEDLVLKGYSIQYMSESESSWNIIELTGTINAYSSFLILGTKTNTEGVYGTLEDDDADMVATFELSNDGFAVCLLSNTISLETVNPFESDVEGYIDMIGCNIPYYENTSAPTPSKQKTVIRTSFDDTNNNANDFITISFKDDTTAWETYAPKSSSSGEWTI